VICQATAPPARTDSRVSYALICLLHTTPPGIGDER